MKKAFLITALLALFSTAWAGEALAMRHGGGRHMGPYGGYCRGPRWGWYGARRHVRTVEEVRELLKAFLQDTELTAGEIRDMETYFEAEIMDPEGNQVDLLIVDKRTCRIRSAY